MNTRVQALIEIKNKHNMSQESLARELGVSTQTVYRWFKGKSNPLVYLEPALDEFISKNN